LTKLRKIIVDEGFTSKAFVSIRLMQSVQKTYNVFRAKTDQRGSNQILEPVADVSYTPAKIEPAFSSLLPSSVKTVKDTMDEFFSLFTEEQAKILKEKSEYENWLNIVELKNKLPIDSLNTEAELNEISKIINE
jgi:hypothetical protein